jgi:hypothetical protein
MFLADVGFAPFGGCPGQAHASATDHRANCRLIDELTFD